MHFPFPHYHIAVTKHKQTNSCNLHDMYCTERTFTLSFAVANYIDVKLPSKCMNVIDPVRYLFLCKCECSVYSLTSSKVCGSMTDWSLSTQKTNKKTKIKLKTRTKISCWYNGNVLDIYVLINYIYWRQEHNSY